MLNICLEGGCVEEVNRIKNSKHICSFWLSFHIFHMNLAKRQRSPLPLILYLFIVVPEIEFRASSEKIIMLVLDSYSLA